MNLENIKSVGDKTINLLNKINIFSVEDLLLNYPYKYNFIKFLKLEEFEENITSYLECEVVSEPRLSFIKRNFNRLSFNALSSNNIISVTIFNRAFLKKNIVPSKKIILIGKYNKLKNTFTASDIKFNLDNNTIEAIYHLSGGLKQTNLKKYINSALELNINISDNIPININEKYKFISKSEAIKKIHSPNTIEDIKKAKLKLIYEELFEFMFKINYLKERNSDLIGIKRNVNNIDVDNFVSNLPFEPTPDQYKAFEEIKKDMLSAKKMNRLVLGDVGSGKTLIAIYSIYLNYLSNYQTAFMAPTEILARQHFAGIKKVLDKYNIRVDIITGKMTKKEKDILKKKLINQEIDLLIGTHSIINDDIIFKNLGLVITDEQHRFGVMQRKNLENKAVNPDILYLSATPIPRTYALILYGDSDVSIVKTKPVGRKEIITKVYKEKDIKEVLISMYQQIKLGKQIFVVSPLIESQEESDLNSVNILKEKLSSAFKENVSIEIMHGAMKQKEKDFIMQQFSENKINILISTTVIEVGIDVPNATVITIFNAERFGLATLHQLRGRVGRGKDNSYCYLICDKDNKRLKVMEESSDGFYITEKDFENRREGDLFGTKQSGDMVFKLADLKKDYEIVLQAKKDAEEYINSKLYLENEYYNNLTKKIDYLN